MNSIREVKRYDITIGGTVHSNFVKTDVWNGLASYVNDKGTVIAKDHIDDSIFSFMFKPDNEPENVKTVIIMASPYFSEDK